MANQAEAMEPINFEQLEGEKFFIRHGNVRFRHRTAV